MKHKCPRCDRSYWGVFKKKTITEYKIIDTNGSLKGNWKIEQVNDTKLLGLRCMACGHETDGSDIKHCDGIKITSNKVYFTTNYWNKLK